ncbi:MAG: shikimate kinase [Vallitaleaceae bacterium]|nr:shikimate kinase [Vallitaleaceae bacterium]
MNNIVLIGFMGSGKTTIGTLLAEKLGVTFTDMDNEIVNIEQHSVKEIFEYQGEQYFRDLESKLIVDLLQVNNQVISTGGGVVLRQENIDNLKKIGIVVFLHAEGDQIYEHIKGDRTRPLLNGDDVQEQIKTLLEQRDPKYLSAANIIIQTTGKSIDNIVDEIITLL